MIFRFTFLILLSVCSLTAHSAHAATKQQTILVFGDSLSAAYGIPREQGWVTLMQQRIKQQGLPYDVVNASISGETTSGGLSRFKQALQSAKPSIVLIELGANDGLRGLPVKDMRSNLSSIVEASRAAGAKPVLIGMMIPPNYGPQYTQAFNGTFTELAHANKLPLVPFLLEGVAGKAELNQDDGVHPLAQAQPALLENVWKVLEPLLLKSR